MKLLSRSEEILLIAIWKLRGNAYGVTIRELVSQMTGQDWTLGAIYVPLDKLTRKEYVKKYMSNPTTERGGRSKCMYDVSEDGKKALKEIREVQDSIWKDVTDIAFDRNF
ncbi:PadR family transcriptional regulator [Bacteroidota bacterium]